MEWAALWSPILWCIYELNAESKKRFQGESIVVASRYNLVCGLRKLLSRCLM
jgi:hypothetical protein